jgi:threonine dehydrogenase-like Zn-dependent dehydrogenase
MGFGVDSVLECVGLQQAVVTAMEIARPGGAVGRVGAPQEEIVPAGIPFWKNVVVGGGPAPARAYMEELMVDVLDEKIEPGRVFDRVTDLDGLPDGYRAMNEREALKVRIRM